MRTPEDIPLNTLRDLLQTHQLALSAIATGQGCLQDEACLCASDQANRRLAIQRLHGHIELAAQFGAAVIIGGIRGTLTGKHEEQAETRKAFVSAVHECARFAQARGVTILVEPINHYETNLINSAFDGLALLGELQEPSVKLLLDTYHMNIEDRDLSASIQTAGKQLGYVHLVDSNRRAPGQGHLEYHPILQTLAGINYAGWITAEILPLPNDTTALQDAARFFRVLKRRAMESVAAS
ncbi:MAG: sugar phosphate isomerase/epimerase [Anaerolineae bacterium]|nr:sugar phosphate isomerase/epimerase [Anaerolineae bacterium]